MTEQPSIKALLPFILLGMAILYIFSYTLIWLQGKKSPDAAATDALFLAALVGIVLFGFYYYRLKQRQ